MAKKPPDTVPEWFPKEPNENVLCQAMLLRSAIQSASKQRDELAHRVECLTDAIGEIETELGNLIRAMQA